MPNPIAPATRQLLTDLRDLMLEQHKQLLDEAKLEYEKTNGPIAGPGPFLGLVMGDPFFAWLRNISTFVVEVDEALSRRSQADQAMAEALVEQAKQMMRPRENGTDFQKRYYAAVQESPDVVILQCRIERLLGI